MRQIFLDTETTGLSADDGDRIVEIGCIEMVARRLTGNHRHYYLNPQRSSHPDALRVHGLTDEFLADKPTFEAVVDELLAFLAGAEIVIHNAAFDVEFLNMELERLGLEPVAIHVAGVVDTLATARELHPGKKNSLDALCERYQIDNSHRTLHGALLDATLLAEVYLAMTRGQESLAIGLEMPAPAPDAPAAPSGERPRITVRRASPEELAEHARLLESIAKETKGKLVWELELASA